MRNPSRPVCTGGSRTFPRFFAGLDIPSLLKKGRRKLVYTVYHAAPQSDAGGSKRYCHGCGKPVVFADSGKVRRNANGKDIYSFNIYKCPRDHTWNRRLEQKDGAGQAVPGDEITQVRLADLEVRGCGRLEIKFTGCREGIRADAVLCEIIPEAGRTKVRRWIEAGCLQVDGRAVKPGHKFKSPAVAMLALELEVTHGRSVSCPPDDAVV